MAEAQARPRDVDTGDTAALIETGEYCGGQFAVVVTDERIEGDGKEAVKTATVSVDGEAVEVVPGKKGFAIRENVAMFSTRLLQDIYARPETYFVRREVARTDQDLARFRREVYNIYQMQRTFEESGAWFMNEHSCRNPFPCEYIPVCYGGDPDAVCDGVTTPPSYKRIFVDLTVGGQETGE